MSLYHGHRSGGRTCTISNSMGCSLLVLVYITAPKTVPQRDPYLGNYPMVAWSTFLHLVCPRNRSLGGISQIKWIFSEAWQIADKQPRKLGSCRGYAIFIWGSYSPNTTYGKVQQPHSVHLAFSEAPSLPSFPPTPLMQTQHLIGSSYNRG